MKKNKLHLLFSLVLLLLSTGSHAQNFKLYFANNTSDVADLANIEDSKELDWRPVMPNGDIYTNAAEANTIMRMFSSPDMKNLTHQQAFWKMRDHSLLCFRINDGNENNEAYGVEATDGSGKVINITVSRYFYANMPLQEAPVKIRVWKIGEKADTLTFQYHVHDWNDQNLYIFQLDSKRQADGEVYNMDYVLSYSDDDGLLKEDTITLKLQRNNFQSFYVPENKELTDVFLTTGAAEKGSKQKKLRIDKSRLHPGAGTDPDFNFLTLTPSFHLDRHANRELVNFNWIGTGLFENFDTLYVKLRRSNGIPITQIEKINVARVDANGNYIPNNQVKYDGYDKSREAHKVITMGNPVYLEILSKGFFPAIYKYPGAYDPISGIVDEERCTAEITMIPGNSKYADFSISDQHFYNLRDTKKVVVYRGVDHALCDLEDVDLSGQPATTTLYFDANAGQEAPKLMQGRSIDKHAQLVMTFSKSKGGGNNIQKPDLVAYDSKTWSELERYHSDANTSAPVTIPIFTYDYYDVSYDLTGMPLDTECRLHLMADDKTYEGLPMFQRIHFDRKKASEETNDEIVNKTIRGVCEEDPLKAGGGDGDANFDVGIPSNYSWGPDLGKNSPHSVKINFSWYVSILKKCLNFKGSMSYTFNPQDEKFSDLRKEQKELANWDKFKKENMQEGDDPNATQKWHGIDASVVSDGTAAKLENWIYKDIDDIFAVPKPGHSFGFNFSVSGFLGFVKKDLDKNGKKKEGANPNFVISEGGGKITYSYGLGIPNYIDVIAGKLGKPGEWISKYLSKFNLISATAVWSAGFDLDFSVKNWADKDLGYDVDGWGFLLTMTGKMKTGAAIELHTPPNPFLHLQAGVRAGLKVAAGFGYGTDYRSHHDFGGMVLGIGILEAYASIRSVLLTGQARAETHLGGRWLFPYADNRNPFHEKYPYWAPTAGAKNAFFETHNEELQGNALWTPEPNNFGPMKSPRYLRHSSRIRKAISNPEDTDFGKAIVTDVTSNANPHYLDENTIVYNDMGKASDYNDDNIAVLNTATGTTTSLSNKGLKASNHMRSKRGKHEIVVYEEMTRPVSESELNTDNDVETATKLGQQQRIMANMRTEGGAWKNMVIAHNPGEVDAKPIVTMQDDGHAACVWQHGQIKTLNRADVADNEYYNTYLDGSLMLSIYNGKIWSAPIQIQKLDATHTIAQYDLMMRNDTVLVGTNITENLLDPEKRTRKFSYASVPLETKVVTRTSENIQPMRFFMNRVGEHAVIAMLYAKNDTLRDIYVKTLNMDGQGNGLAGNDLGANFCTPELVKIVCDRSANRLNDFAVLWTEMNNTAHGTEGTSKDTGKTRLMLNASRIALDPTMRITAPLTLGAETDELFMMDFDGFLDDQHIKVVYSLADTETDEAVIVQSERYFTNSFRYEVCFSRTSLLGSSTMPVEINVINTGTSTINHVTVSLNGHDYSIDNSYVPPMQSRNFVVEYPLDNFDGYLSTKVLVDYDNVFRASMHARRKNVSLLRQLKQTAPRRVVMENIEMRLIGQGIEDGVNIFTVELIDRSTRGLNPDNEVHVGVYAHPAYPVPLTDGAITVVRSSDFHSFGGVRKAYATIRAEGVVETTDAYLSAHIYDTKQAAGQNPLVNNASYSDNIHYVILQPSNDPTAINPVRFDEQKARLNIRITNEEGGVRISGLSVRQSLSAEGEAEGTRVRVFNSAGMAIYSEPSTAETIFVPLKQHDVYVLSTGKDILKFKF